MIGAPGRDCSATRAPRRLYPSSPPKTEKLKGAESGPIARRREAERLHERADNPVDELAAHNGREKVVGAHLIQEAGEHGRGLDPERSTDLGGYWSNRNANRDQLESLEDRQLVGLQQLKRQGAYLLAELKSVGPLRVVALEPRVELRSFETRPQSRIVASEKNGAFLEHLTGQPGGSLPTADAVCGFEDDRRAACFAHARRSGQTSQSPAHNRDIDISLCGLVGHDYRFHPSRRLPHIVASLRTYCTTRFRIVEVTVMSEETHATPTQIADAMIALGVYDGANTDAEHEAETKRLGGVDPYRLALINALLGAVQSEAIEAEKGSVTSEQRNAAHQFVFDMAGLADRPAATVGFLRWQTLRVSLPLREMASRLETGPIAVAAAHAADALQQLLEIVETGQDLTAENVESLPHNLETARGSLTAAITNTDMLVDMIKSGESLADRITQMRQ